jgi:hypothetical protein
MTVLPSWTSTKELKALLALYDKLEEMIKRRIMDDDLSNIRSSDSSGAMDELDGSSDDTSDDSSSNSSDASPSDDDDMDDNFIFEWTPCHHHLYQDDDDMMTMADSDDEDSVQKGSTTSTRSTVGLLISKIVEQEEVLFAPNGKNYIVGVFFQNLQTTFYGNQTSNFFGIVPMNIDEYLGLIYNNPNNVRNMNHN